MKCADASTSQLRAALLRVATAQAMCGSGYPELMVEAAKRLGVRRSKVGVAKKGGRHGEHRGE